MSNVSKRKKEGSRGKIKTMGDHKEFLKRITKTLYYGQLPALPCLSLPVTEISCELWSVAQRGRSLRRLRAHAAAATTRSACVSPCALVLAILYLERLKRCNPDYLSAAAPDELFLVSLMVSNKFLQDDGEDEEVICSEWATSGGLKLAYLKKLEVDFLNAIDWNVFVSEQSFETGLAWLERQVALRQARVRGFFTYSDLACSCDSGITADLAAALAAAGRALALASVASLVTLLTSTLLMTHALLPALRQSSHSTQLKTTSTHDTMHNETPVHDTNTTLDLDLKLLADKCPDGLRCCQQWHKYEDTNHTKPYWYDTVLFNKQKLEPWWSKTLTLNWLYRSSILNPMQRWLDKMTQYADFLQLDQKMVATGRCAHKNRKQHCLTLWSNLSRLGVYATAVSDR